MEDVKWLLKKCGLPILILLFAVIAGVICGPMSRFSTS